MPNYLIPGLWGSEVDRVGPAYNRGLGSAKVSTYAAGVDGYIQGQKEGVATEAAALQSQRLNDPKKLADEALYRQLRNDLLDQNITSAIISNKSLDARYNASIAASLAATDLTREKLRVSRMYGEDDAEIDRLTKLTNISSAQEKIRASKAKRQQGGYSIEDLDTMSKIAERTSKMSGGSGGGGASSGGGTFGEGLSFEPPQEGTSQATEEMPNAQTPLDAINNRILDTLNKSLNTKAVGDALDTTGQLEDEQNVLEMRTKAMFDKINLGVVSKDNYRKAIEASRDTSLGTPNVEAGLPHILKLSSAITKSNDPKQQALFGSYLSDVMNSYGGADKLLDSIDDSVTDPEQNKQLKAAIFGATARSLSPDQLPQEQKDLLDAGLGIEHIEDPNATYDNIAKLISSNRTQVDDSVLKGALTNHRFLAAASEASQDGAQPFIVKTRLAGDQQSEIDTASRQPQADTYLEFTSSDGSIVRRVDGPRNAQEQALLSVFDKVSSQQASQLGSRQRVDKQIGGIQQLQEDARSAPPARVMPPQEQPSVGTEGLNFDPNLNIREGMGRPTEPAPTTTATGSDGYPQGIDVANPQELAQDGATKPNVPTVPTNYGNMPIGVKTPVAPGIDVTVSNPTKNGVTYTKIDNQNIGATIYDPPISPALHQQQIASKFPKDKNGQLSSKDVERVYTIHEDYNKRWDTDTANLSKRADTLETYATADRDIKRKLENLRDDIDRTGTAYLFGRNGYIAKQGSIAAAKLAIADPVALDIISKFEKRKAELLGVTKERNELGVKNLDAAAEIEFWSSVTLSDNSELSVIDDFIQTLDYDIQANDNKVRLYSELKDQRYSVDGGNASGIWQEYARNKTARPMIYDGTKGEYVRNPEYRSPDQYLGKTVPPGVTSTPPTDTTPGGGGGGGGMTTETPTTDTGGMGVQGTAEGTTQGAAREQPVEGTEPPPEAAAPEKQTFMDRLGEIFTPETREEFDKRMAEKAQAPEEDYIETAYEFVTNLPENIKKSREQEKKRILGERNTQDPEFRKDVEDVKSRIMSLPSMFNPMGDRTQNEAVFSFIDSVTMGAMDDVLQGVAEYSGKGAEKLTRLFGADATADEIANTTKTWVEALGEIKDDYKMKNPNLALATEIASYATFGAGLRKLGAMGITAATSRSPAIAGMVKSFNDAVKAGSWGARLLGAGGRAVTEGVTNVAVGEEGSAFNRFIIGAASAPVGEIVAKGISGGVKGVADLTKWMTGKGIDADRLVAEAVIERGVSKEAIDIARQKATEKGGHWIAELSGQDRQIFKDLIETPDFKVMLEKAGGTKELTKGLTEGVEESAQAVGFDKAKPLTDIGETITTSAQANIDDAVAKVSERADAVQRQSVGNMVNKITSKFSKKAAKDIDNISALTQRAYEEEAAALTKLIQNEGSQDVGSVLGRTVDNMRATVETLKGTRRSIFQSLDERFPVLPGDPGTEYAKYLRGAFGDRAEGLINSATTASQSGKNKSVQGFKFLSELQQQVANSNLKPKQKGEALKTLYSMVRNSAKKEGLPPEEVNMLQDAFRQYGQISGTIRTGERQAAILQDIRMGLKDDKTSLSSSILGSGKKYDKLVEEVGKKTANDIKNKLQVIDRTTKILKEIGSGKVSPDTLAKSKVSGSTLAGASEKTIKGMKSVKEAKQFYSDLQKTIKTVGNDVNFGEKLVNTKSPTLMNSIRRSLPQSQKALLKDMGLRVVKDASEKISPTSTTKLANKGGNVYELVGLDADKWGVVQEMVGKDTAKMLNTFFDRKLTQGIMEDFFTISTPKGAEGVSKSMMTRAARRMGETWTYALDLISSKAMGRMNANERQAIAKMFTNPNYAELDANAARIASMITEKEAGTGATVLGVDVSKAASKAMDETGAVEIGAMSPYVQAAKKKAGEFLVDEQKIRDLLVWSYLSKKQMTEFKNRKVQERFDEYQARRRAKRNM